MTTVVTGATGFLGSALVTELVKRQQSVRILARDGKGMKLTAAWYYQYRYLQASQYATLGGARKS
jgi:uncharacterized protein YbjT (DUF2867 family)